jgi:hypothetical protein
LGVRSIIPPTIGRPTDKPPTYWRRRMKRTLRTKRSRRRCGYTQRWQAETVVSMIKRNLGSALAGRTADSRKRDMLLKVLTHNVMIIRRQRRVETEHDGPVNLARADDWAASLAECDPIDALVGLAPNLPLLLARENLLDPR